MKTIRMWLVLLVLLGSAFYGRTAIVDESRAATAALNAYDTWYTQHLGPIVKSSFEIIDDYVHREQDLPVYYVFEFRTGGFVIISAEDATPPLIGIALEGRFPDPVEPSDNYGSFLQSYADAIVEVRKQQLPASASTRQLWDRLLEDSKEAGMVKGSGDSVEPLLHSLWNQGFPYNLLCPPDPEGDGGHTVTGCGATCMAQVMHYWRYPQTGTGSHMYNSIGYGMQQVQFGETTYQWNQMQNSIDHHNPEAIAQLMYHIGVSINMQYGPVVSNSFPWDMVPALQGYFGYDAAVYHERSNYSTADWSAMICSNLDQSIPLIYLGYSSTGGHGFVCDGYLGDLFHFNFGWNGLGNGYYTLDDAYGYGNNQKCITGIYPTDPGYPWYASGADTIQCLSGSLTDGSGPAADYLNNTSASWLINPQTEQDSVSYINVSFVEFETADNDWLTIYDGPSEADPVLISLSGDEFPEQISSTGNQLLITFHTDGDITAKGWQLEFDAVYPDYCNATTILTDPSGVVSDGSGSFHYTAYTTCMWMIEPQWADQIKLSFTSFETEEGFDMVKIYDGNTQVAVFSGNEIPDPVFASSGSMAIIFFTNGYNHYGGWEAEWEVTNVGMPPGIPMSDVQIFPNPAQKAFTLSLQNQQGSSCHIELLTASGECVYAETIQHETPSIRKSVSTDHLPGGIYFLKILSGNRVLTHKLIIL
ncbi:MAG: C10 family peptidase [Bacteroidetes bacterium]|nr:C10 family peptidase [Bacteroidota bacterium]